MLVWQFTTRLAIQLVFLDREDNASATYQTTALSAAALLKQALSQFAFPSPPLPRHHLNRRDFRCRHHGPLQWPTLAKARRQAEDKQNTILVNVDRWIIMPQGRLTLSNRSYNSPTVCLSFPFTQLTQTPGPSMTLFPQIGVPSCAACQTRCLRITYS